MGKKTIQIAFFLMLTSMGTSQVLAQSGPSKEQCQEYDRQRQDAEKDFRSTQRYQILCDTGRWPDSDCMPGVSIPSLSATPSGTVAIMPCPRSSPALCKQIKKQMEQTKRTMRRIERESQRCSSPDTPSS